MGEWISNCDICGFRFHSSDLKENWQGLMVCREDFEVRHPQDFLKGVPDDPSVPWSRPETGAVTCGPSSVPDQAVPDCAIPNFSDGYTNPL